MAVQLPFIMGFKSPPQETSEIKRVNSNLCSKFIIIERLFLCQHFCKPNVVTLID